MVKQNSLPLYEKIWIKHTFSRVMDSFILLLLLLLLGYRVSSHGNHHTFPWFLAFLCESWFTITWITTMTTKWTPARTNTFLDRLSRRYIHTFFNLYSIFIQLLLDCVNVCKFDEFGFSI